MHQTLTTTGSSSQYLIVQNKIINKFQPTLKKMQINKIIIKTVMLSK